MIKYIFIVIMGMTMATNSSKLYAGELKKATSSAVSILKGSKNVETRDIWVQDFTKIKIMVDAEVHYSQTDEGVNLSMTIDDNLFDVFEVTVDVNTLIIRPKDKYKTTKIQPTKFVINISSDKLEMISNTTSARWDIQTEVVVKELKIENTGCGSIYSMKSFDIEELVVENTGSGNITLVGKANEAKILLIGSGKINMENCAVKDFSCENSGTGDIYVFAVDFLTCQISGKGNIYYMGKPEIKKDIVGKGRLIRR